MGPDTVYSLTLLGAIIAAVISLAAAFRSRPVAAWALAISIAAAVISVSVHYSSGHSVTSSEPMSIGEFLWQHKAYSVVFVLLIAAIISLRWPGSAR